MNKTTIIIIATIVVVVIATVVVVLGATSCWSYNFNKCIMKADAYVIENADELTPSEPGKCAVSTGGKFGSGWYKDEAADSAPVLNQCYRSQYGQGWSCSLGNLYWLDPDTQDEWCQKPKDFCDKRCPQGCQDACKFKE